MKALIVWRRCKTFKNWSIDAVLVLDKLNDEKVSKKNEIERLKQQGRKFVERMFLQLKGTVELIELECKFGWGNVETSNKINEIYTYKNLKEKSVRLEPLKKLVFKSKR